MFVQTVVGNVGEVEFRDVKAVKYKTLYVVNENLLCNNVKNFVTYIYQIK